MSGGLQRPESGDIELGRPLETAADGGNNQTENTCVTELENSFESYNGNVEDQGSNSELHIQIPTYFNTYAQNGESVKYPPHSYIQNQQP